MKMCKTKFTEHWGNTITEFTFDRAALGFQEFKYKMETLHEGSHKNSSISTTEITILE